MATFGQIPSNEEAISGIGTKQLVGEPGITSPSNLKVTERGAGANMSVDVAAGTCYIDQAGSKMGEATTTAVTNLAIASNSSGSTRIDLVVIAPGSIPEIVQGNPGAGAPAIPANKFALAQVSVASGASSITNANITDRREYGGLFRRPRGLLQEAASTTDFGLSTSDQQIETISLTLEADRQLVACGMVSFRRSTGSTDFMYARIWEDAISTGTVRGIAYCSPPTTGSAGQTTVTFTTRPWTTVAETEDFYLAAATNSGGGIISSQGGDNRQFAIHDAGGLDKPTGSEGQ